MRKLIITNVMLKDYYESRFHNDLADYFEIGRNAEGINVVNEIQWSSDIFYHAPAEKQILFLALASFMLSAEDVLLWKAARSDKDEMCKCLNAFGFPIVPMADRHYGLDSLLKACELHYELDTIEEVEILRDVVKLVEPFMFDKLIPHIKSWNNGFFSNQVTLFLGLEDRISSTITEGLQMVYCRIYDYRGLTGFEITHRDFEDYYTHHFYPQFRRYFSCAEDKGTYLQVLHVYDRANHRWADEMPGRDMKENFLFASIVLYMVIAEQSILEHAPSAHKDFHQCFGWPMIYSGPGAGPYLHPLKMLEYAGISPKKYETPLFLEVVRKVFYYLRQEMNTLLNVRQSVIKDPIAGKRFFEIVNGHTKSRIRKYLDRQEKSVQQLLAKWTTSPEDCWYKMLESEGIPIMMEIRNHK